MGKGSGSHEERVGLPLDSAEQSSQEALAQAAYLTRNAAQCLPEGELAHKLSSGRRLRIKLGMDPTSPDIHLGHAVVLGKLREFQDLGHTVVLIIGDYTARVGDPSGRSSTRPQLSGAEIDAAAATYQEQAFTVLDPERTEVRYNSEWLDMSMPDLFTLTRQATVSQILERNDFAERIRAQQPISVLELLYPLMQAKDSVEIRADVEMGGTDQTFNLMLGRDLQQHAQMERQTVFTMPVLVGTDGTQKMSKSLDNSIGVREPANDMFGKLMSIPDQAMPGYYAALSKLEFNKAAHPMESKRALARDITARFHNQKIAQESEAHFDQVHKHKQLPTDVEAVHFSPQGDSVFVPALIAEAFGVTRGEARRLLKQRGVRLDGEPMDDSALELARDQLDGRVIQLGPKRFRRVNIDS